MKKIFLFLASLVICLQINAHSAKEAFFTFKVDTTLSVEAEFPWTIRKALIKDYPELATIKSKTVIDSLCVEYLKENFRVFNDAGIINPVEKVVELPNSGHSHSYKVKMIFRDLGFQTIKNSLMFNLNENQINFHEVILDGEVQYFQTNQQKSTFKVRQGIPCELWVIVIGFIVLTIAFALLVKRKRSLKL